MPATALEGRPPGPDEVVSEGTADEVVRFVGDDSDDVKFKVEDGDVGTVVNGPNGESVA